ncbi:helix-turn-helix domain-containing protein [Sharpea azabuensis]|uniref:helix-turn-helix domain-containing protein n=1 Tax=Sharpea azabuensis TaxID=322505 RepID=UPI002409D86C|nr:helix-turn-helix transcriptional regulator [Sharpea azabuensis]MDD6511976.1 helix-turn-helix transcriptional regulator [Sharpea azabuensis]
MKTIDIGALCYRVRKRRDISQEKLIYGICKQSAYSKFEKNEISLSKDMTERLLKRLGLSSSNFLFLISQKDHEYQEWKKQLIQLINAKDYDKAFKALQLRKEKENDLQHQFHLFILGYLTNDLNIIQQALLISLPKLNHIYLPEMALSADEMKMLLYYWKKEGRLLQNTNVIKNCMEYTDLYYVDEEKAKLFDYELDIMKQIKMDEKDQLLYRYFSMKRDALFHQYHFHHDALSFEIANNSMPLHTYLYNKRIEKNMTQEEISENICSVVTYSRFENGKQDMSSNSIKQLFHKLNLEYGYVLCDDHWQIDDML